MPKGKGTYGSKVGRPSKKYPTGGMLNGASHEQGGIPIEAEGGEFIIQNDSVNEETLPILEQINETGDFPTSDAMFRSENYQLGGQVKPPTAPSMPQYKEGGPVKSDRQRNLEGAKARLESAKKGRYYDVDSKTVKTHKDEKKKQKTIERAKHSVKHYGG